MKKTIRLMAELHGEIIVRINDFLSFPTVKKSISSKLSHPSFQQSISFSSPRKIPTNLALPKNKIHFESFAYLNCENFFVFQFVFTLIHAVRFCQVEEKNEQNEISSYTSKPSLLYFRSYTGVYSQKGKRKKAKNDFDNMKTTSVQRKRGQGIACGSSE